MQEFSFDSDGTVAEFKNRVERMAPTGVVLRLDHPRLYICMAAALWHAMETYEKETRKELKNDNKDSPSEFRALHSIVHDMRDTLQGMFSNVGMALTDVPMNCAMTPEEREAEKAEIMQVVGDLKKELQSLFKDSGVDVMLMEVSPDGVVSKDLEGFVPDPEVSADEETGSVDSEAKPE